MSNKKKHVKNNEMAKVKMYLVNTQTALTAMARILGIDPEKLAATIKEERECREYEGKVLSFWKGAVPAVETEAKKE